MTSVLNIYRLAAAESLTTTHDEPSRSRRPDATLFSQLSQKNNTPFLQCEKFSLPIFSQDLNSSGLQEAMKMLFDILTSPK